jgi:glutathione S-transferase
VAIINIKLKHSKRNSSKKHMSRIQIHHLAPLTRSSRVMWLLEELGPQAQAQVDVKTYDLVKPETFQTDEFRQISPLARFPVLVHGDLVLLESVAINNYILRTLAPESPLLPKDSKELALVESISAFTIAHIDDLTFRGAMETFFTPIEKKSRK